MMRYFIFTSLAILLLNMGPVYAQKADSIKMSNGVLYYYSYGDGNPVILLSGGPGVSAHQEDDLANELSKKYKAILFDQRGTGNSWTSPFDSTTINIDTAIGDIERLRKHLGIRKLILTGHSWGAILAAAYTERYPKNVGGLVLIGGGELDLAMTNIIDANIQVRDQISDDSAYNYWSNPENRKANPEKAEAELRRIKWSNFVYDRKKLDTVMQQVTRGSYTASMGEYMWASMRRKNFNIISQLRRKYNGSALVIFGWQDPIGSLTYPLYEKAFRKSQIKGINKCGHMPSIEQPKEFFESVFSYLNTVVR